MAAALPIPHLFSPAAPQAPAPLDTGALPRTRQGSPHARSHTLQASSTLLHGQRARQSATKICVQMRPPSPTCTPQLPCRRHTLMQAHMHTHMMVRWLPQSFKKWFPRTPCPRVVRKRCGRPKQKLAGPRPRPHVDAKSQRPTETPVAPTPAQESGLGTRALAGAPRCRPRATPWATG